jgi:hypothetical protein
VRTGKIYPSDTYMGFRRIGFNMLLSAYAVLVIHGTFSYPSQDTWWPDPLLSVNLGNIHQCKHGSDSETYDTEGRFVPVHSQAWRAASGSMEASCCALLRTCMKVITCKQASARKSCRGLPWKGYSQSLATWNVMLLHSVWQRGSILLCSL